MYLSAESTTTATAKKTYMGLADCLLTAQHCSGRILQASHNMRQGNDARVALRVEQSYGLLAISNH